MANGKFWKSCLAGTLAGTCIVGGVALCFAAPAAAPVGSLAIIAIVGVGVVIAGFGTCGAMWQLRHRPQGEQQRMVVDQEE